MKIEFSNMSFQETFQPWQLVLQEPDFSHGPAPTKPPMPKMAKDRFRHLAGKTAIVTGAHPKKGEQVTINRSGGNGTVHVSNVGSQWAGDLDVRNLLDPE